MINRANVWQSSEEWNFQKQDVGVFLIENVSQEKVLEGQEDKTVKKEDMLNGTNEQLWIMENSSVEDYFFLKNFNSDLVLSATLGGKKNST